MKGFVRILFVLLFFLFSCIDGHTVSFLFRDGKTNFDIYIYPNSTQDLQEEVKKFQNYLNVISGASFKVATIKKEANQIVIGNIELAQKDDIGITDIRLKPGGFVIKTNKGNLFILGFDNKGTINGLYTFLEEYLDCRYYAKDAVMLPKKESYILSEINDVQNPAFQLSILNSYAAFSPSYCNWHKLMLPPRVNPLWLKPWIHTSTIFISPKEYYKLHPEYFMLWKGKRIKKEIDFSNEDVFEIIEKKIAKKIQATPKIDYIGISQADRNPRQYCTCKVCSNIMKKYGTPSSTIINMANRVALRFPNKTITTLAYKYSQEPPKEMDIQENVMVIVCNTELDRLKATNLQQDNQFVKDLNGWKKLTHNIMVWDYISDYAYPYTPFPNFSLMQKSIKNLKMLGINKIFIEGNGQKGFEFQELRSYLAAKLIWNPDIDIWAVIEDFVNGYYGAAAPYIMKYIMKMHEEFIQSGQPLLRNAPPSKYKNSFLSPSSLSRYQTYIDKAKNEVKNNQILWNRVDKLEQSIRYSKLEIFPRSEDLLYSLKAKTGIDSLSLSKAEYSELLKEFVEKSKKYGGTKITFKYRNPKAFQNAKGLK